jgi:hypothetical protein
VQAALGQAEFAIGDYKAAREAFLQAVRINPADRQSADRAELSEYRLVQPKR